MFDRDNLIGYVLLGLCAVAGGVLIISIATGTRLRYTGPGWLGLVLMALFLGGIIFGLRGSGRGRWPDPRTGRGRGIRWPWRRGERSDGNDR